VPGDARGHIFSETGQAEPGTLGEAGQRSLKDRRGGATRDLIAGKARRRGTGLPGKRRRRNWKQEDLGQPEESRPVARKMVATRKLEALSLARPMD